MSVATYFWILVWKLWNFLREFSECFGNNQSCGWLFCPMMSKHLINLLQDIIIITPDKTIDYDKTRPQGGTHIGRSLYWDTLSGLKTPIFRSLYNTALESRPTISSPPFPSPKASLFFLMHFQARLIFA